MSFPALQFLTRAPDRLVGRRVLSSVGGMIAVCDADFTIRFANATAGSFLGMPARDLVGRNGFDFVHPEDRARATLDLGHCLSAPGASAHAEFRVTGRDTGWRHVSALAVNQVADAAIRGILLTGHDVTERRVAEERIRESEALHRELVEQAADAIFTTCPDGTITDGNAAMCALTGYSHAELCNMHTFELYVAEEQGLARQALALVARGEPLSAQRHLQRRDHTVVAVEIHARRLRDGRLHGILRDVSLRESRAERLHRSQRLESLGLLAAGIGHDFNNILTVIMSNAALAASTVEPASAAAEMLSDISNAAKCGAAMVRRLARGSKLDALEISDTDLGALVGRLKRTIDTVLPSDIALTVDVDPGLPPVLADVAAVEECLLNISANARDAMPSGGALQIRVERASVGRQTAEHDVAMLAGDFVTVALRDTGTGMNAATLARVFEPYFTTKAPDTGTGLGLAMVYRIMKQQSGFASIESREAEGTTVRLYFAVARKPRADPDQ